jgi:hypothetical protein
MSPEQITERLDEITDVIDDAIDKIADLRKLLTGDVMLDDIRSDLRLGRAEDQLREMYRHISITQTDDLPEYFARMRTGAA